MSKQRIEEEKIAIKISKTLRGLCPSFSSNGSGAVEWHKCDCQVTGSACTCVWHLTDTCVAGKWEKLSFVEKYNQEKVANQNKELTKATAAANKSNNEEESVDDRFEILDL